MPGRVSPPPQQRSRIVNRALLRPHPQPGARLIPKPAFHSATYSAASSASAAWQQMETGFAHGEIGGRRPSCQNLELFPSSPTGANPASEDSNDCFSPRYYALVTPVSNLVLVTKGQLSQWTRTATVASRQHISSNNL